MRSEYPKEVSEALLQIILINKADFIGLLTEMKLENPKEVIDALVKIILEGTEDLKQKAFQVLKEMKSKNPDFSKILEEALSKNLDNEKSLKHYKDVLSKSSFERVKISIQGKTKATRK